MHYAVFILSLLSNLPRDLPFLNVLKEKYNALKLLRTLYSGQRRYPFDTKIILHDKLLVSRTRYIDIRVFNTVSDWCQTRRWSTIKMPEMIHWIIHYGLYIKYWRISQDCVYTRTLSSIFIDKLKQLPSRSVSEHLVNNT